MQNRLLITQYLLRLKLSLLLGVILALLSGCGIGNGFTGGGVPIGRAVIIGQAVSATAPNQPLANALVYVSVSTNSVNSANAPLGLTLTATTDSSGRFNFSDIPVDTAPTSIRVAVDPKTTAFIAQQVLFKLDKGNKANLIVTLAPASVNLSSVSSIVLSPTSNVFTSLTGQINAQAQDSSGISLQLTPSLLLIGDFSVFQANGTFTSTHEQVGTVEAFWYNNLQISGTLSIQNNGNGSPPPPPDAGKGTPSP